MARVNASGIFLVRKDGKLLICHPTGHATSFWSIPKGKVEQGESFVDAAFRETWEETNLDLSASKNLRRLEPVIYTHKKKMLHPFLFLESENLEVEWNNCEIKCNSNVPSDRGNFPEMDAYKFVTLDEAKGLLHYTQVACLAEIKKLFDDHD